MGEFIALYAVAWGVGGVVVWLMPNDLPDPDFGIDPGAGRWGELEDEDGHDCFDHADDDERPVRR